MTLVIGSRTRIVDHAPPGPPCAHEPACPSAESPDHDVARAVAAHPEQGWSLLCNGVIVFEDTGELLPGGLTVAPHRPTDRVC